MAKKRAFGEGTIYYNEKRDRWEGQFPYADDTTGKTKRKLFTGKTQKKVADKGKAFLKDIEGGLLPSADKITLGKWLDTWLEDYIKPTVRIKTYEKYKSCLATYVKPKLGNESMKSIKAPDIQRLFNDMLSKGGVKGNGLSTSTVRGTRRYLSMAYSRAVQVGVISSNIVLLTKSPALVKEDIKPLSEEQARKLLKVAKSENYLPERYYDFHTKEATDYLKTLNYVVVLLALNSGMRIGEIFGLNWFDIDFDNATININRSLNYSSTQGMIFQEPKTRGSKRKISIPIDVINALKAFKKKQDRYIKLVGSLYEDKVGLVFASWQRKPFDTKLFTRRNFKRMLEKAGINNTFTFHDLRHTHATLLLRDGVNIKVISERLGHSTITMTLDTYSHLMPDMQQTAVLSLEKLFSPKKRQAKSNK